MISTPMPLMYMDACISYTPVQVLCLSYHPKSKVKLRMWVIAGISHECSQVLLSSIPFPLADF